MKGKVFDAYFSVVGCGLLLFELVVLNQFMRLLVAAGGIILCLVGVSFSFCYLAEVATGTNKKARRYTNTNVQEMMTSFVIFSGLLLLTVSVFVANS